eukprot:3344202-Rhodomonas_salina.1
MESARFGQQLEALSLNGCLLGAGGVQRLVKALGGCPRLAELALGNNVFGDEGAIALADLQRCSGLTDLKLDDSRFSRVGTARMLWLAATCTQIQRLDLSDKGGPLEVFAASADWLEGNTGLELKLGGLQSVDLSGLRLHDDIAGLARVLRASQQLRHLNLSKNLSTDAGATGLASGLALCSTLTHLDMGHNQVPSQPVRVRLACRMIGCQSLTAWMVCPDPVARSYGAGGRLEPGQRGCGCCKERWVWACAEAVD